MTRNGLSKSGHCKDSLTYREITRLTFFEFFSINYYCCAFSLYVYNNSLIPLCSFQVHLNNGISNRCSTQSSQHTDLGENNLIIVTIQTSIKEKPNMGTTMQNTKFSIEEFHMQRTALFLLMEKIFGVIYANVPCYGP